MYNYKNHRSNYHTHTYLCRHAEGRVIDYVKKAVKEGFHTLGMTDHAPFELLRRWGSGRMSPTEYLNEYLPMLDEADDYAKKHNLKLYRGVEIEYYRGYNDHYEKLLEDLDFLILGEHYLYENGKLRSSYDIKTLRDVIYYRDQLIEGLETGYFSLLCHPEVCFYSIPNPTEEMYEALRPLIKVAVKMDISIEINANGIRRLGYSDKVDFDRYKQYVYPKPRFWQIAKEEGATAIITSDSHSLDTINDWAVKEAYQFAKDMGVHLIEELPFRNNKFRKKG